MTTGRIIVCGGRAYSDQAIVFHCLNQLKEQGRVSVIVHGDARGADTLAGNWARTNGITEDKYPANWSKDGRAAGPIRNQRMADRGADMLVAFPGGTGTVDMVRRARAAGILVWEIPESI